MVIYTFTVSTSVSLLTFVAVLGVVIYHPHSFIIEFVFYIKVKG